MVMESNDGNGMDEQELQGLAARAKAGDRKAFEELYGVCRRRVLGLCLRLLDSYEDAEDAVSEIFLKMGRALESYDTSLPFTRWMLRVAGNHCIDCLRRRSLEGRLFVSQEITPDVFSGREESPLAQVLHGEQRARLREAMDRLPDSYRIPFVLRYFNEMSYDEIGAALNLTRNRVATLIFRAKKELRRRCHWWAKEQVV